MCALRVYCPLRLNGAEIVEWHMAILVTSDRSGIPQHGMPFDLFLNDVREERGIGFVGSFPLKVQGIMVSDLLV